MNGNKTGVKIDIKEKILLVDDDSTSLKVAWSTLQSKGYVVEIAHKAKEALTLIRDSDYSLVILDILLPDMSGVELLTSINRIQPDIITVVSAGYSSIETSIQSLNLGAFSYLEKPLKSEKLLEVVQRGLEKRQLLLENRRLLKELEQRNRDLNILTLVGQTVTGSMNPEQIVKSALDIVAQSSGIKGSYMLIFHNNTFDIEKYQGFDRQLAEEFKSAEFKEKFIQVVFTQNEPIIFNQIKDVSGRLFYFLEQRGYKSLLVVPVTAAEGDSGIMIVATPFDNIFTSLEVGLFKAIGREIANAIKNSQLLEEASGAKALRELDALRTELLANVSHELRTPLAAIKGFASSLLQKDVNFDDETRTSFIRTIDREADRMSRMIEDLLLMSRIEAGAFKARKEWYEMTEILNFIHDRLCAIAIKHSLKIVVPEDLPILMVDGPRIGEVITNLVENAVKYSPDGSEITIIIERQTQNILISVIDHGVGIPEEYQASVFDRFNQLANKKGQRKGSGLGLCICRGIVESHGGKIWVESKPGQGAKFSFNLPLTVTAENDNKGN